MKHRWIIPLILLIILLLLMAFRWETISKKTIDFTVIEWKKDRWTGYTWTHIVDIRMGEVTVFIPVKEEPSKEKTASARQVTDFLTYLAIVLILIFFVWFLADLRLVSRSQTPPGKKNNLGTQ